MKISSRIKRLAAYLVFFGYPTAAGGDPKESEHIPLIVALFAILAMGVMLVLLFLIGYGYLS